MTKDVIGGVIMCVLMLCALHVIAILITSSAWFDREFRVMMWSKGVKVRYYVQCRPRVLGVPYVWRSWWNLPDGTVYEDETFDTVEEAMAKRDALLSDHLEHHARVIRKPIE